VDNGSTREFLWGRPAALVTDGRAPAPLGSCAHRRLLSAVGGSDPRFGGARNDEPQG